MDSFCKGSKSISLCHQDEQETSEESSLLTVAMSIMNSTYKPTIHGISMPKRKIGCRINPRIDNWMNDLAIPTIRVFSKPNSNLLAISAMHNNGNAESSSVGVATWTTPSPAASW